MSLIRFHRVLIGTAIVFCAGFAVRELVVWWDGRAMLDLLLAFAFFVAAGAFANYLRRLTQVLNLPEK
jgi:hypothetical protein